MPKWPGQVDAETGREIVDKAAFLASMPTRGLLRWLRWTYIYGGHYDPGWAQWDFPKMVEPFTAEEIKAELATREHVPNKPEGEVIRKARQKTRREGRNNRCVRRR